MNKIEPADRFSPEAVRKHESEGQAANQPGRLNETARQVAAQYRRDTMSPIMVSGVLRIVELTLLIVSGALLFINYVGLGTGLDDQREEDRRLADRGQNRLGLGLRAHGPEPTPRSARACARADRRPDYFTLATTTLTFSPASTPTFSLLALRPSLSGLVHGCQSPPTAAVGQAQTL